MTDLHRGSLALQVIAETAHMHNDKTVAAVLDKHELTHEQRRDAIAQCFSIYPSVQGNIIGKFLHHTGIYSKFLKRWMDHIMLPSTNGMRPKLERYFKYYADFIKADIIPILEERHDRLADPDLADHARVKQNLSVLEKELDALRNDDPLIYIAFIREIAEHTCVYANFDGTRFVDGYAYYSNYITTILLDHIAFLYGFTKESDLIQTLHRLKELSLLKEVDLPSRIRVDERKSKAMGEAYFTFEYGSGTAPKSTSISNTPYKERKAAWEQGKQSYLESKHSIGQALLSLANQLGIPPTLSDRYQFDTKKLTTTHIMLAIEAGLVKQLMQAFYEAEHTDLILKRAIQPHEGVLFPNTNSDTASKMRETSLTLNAYINFFLPMAEEYQEEFSIGLLELYALANNLYCVEFE